MFAGLYSFYPTRDCTKFIPNSRFGTSGTGIFQHRSILIVRECQYENLLKAHDESHSFAGKSEYISREAWGLVHNANVG
jgi:hypothetical protein